MRTIVLASVLVVGVLSAPASGGDAASRWTARDLGTLGGATSVAVGINSKGVVVGASDLPASPRSHAFVWSNGRMRDLGVLFHDLGGDMPSLSRAVAINDAGVILGNGSVEQNSPNSNAFVTTVAEGRLRPLSGPGDDTTGTDLNTHGAVAGFHSREIGFGLGTAFIWRNGRLTDLGSLPGRGNSWAHALNDGGVVVGESYRVDMSVGGEQLATHAFLWRQGKMTDLGTLPGTDSCSASGINGRGVVIGACWKSNGLGAPFSSRGFVWVNGTLTELPGIPACINDRGQIAGTTRARRGFLWRNGSTIYLGALRGGVQSTPVALSERGDVVGSSHGRVFVWRNGSMSDLGPGAPTAINERGQVVGRRNGHGTLWAPAGA